MKKTENIEESDPVFLHLDYENYESIYFGKPNPDYCNTRMVPPG